MNFLPPPAHIIIEPPSGFNIAENNDLENNSAPEQDNENEDLSLQQVNTEPNFLTKLPVLGWMFKVFFAIGKGIAWIFIKLKNQICQNKMTGLFLLQMFLLLLRILHIIDARQIIWLSFIPILFILILSLMHLCINAQRTSTPLRRQHIHAPDQTNNRGNLRRDQVLDELNQRIMEHILFNAAPNRMDFLVTGQRGGMRFVHPQDDINGTRMQIRLISRGLLRLLAEFIEEQQLQQTMNQRSAGLNEEQINNIPLEKYLIPLTGIEEPETCSICIDEFKQEQDLRRLPCRHRFHKNCVDEWLKISSTCPNCKAELQEGREAEQRDPLNQA